jgi:hypothetical protein
MLINECEAWLGRIDGTLGSIFRGPRRNNLWRNTADQDRISCLIGVSKGCSGKEDELSRGRQRSIIVSDGKQEHSELAIDSVSRSVRWLRDLYFVKT